MSVKANISVTFERIFEALKIHFEKNAVKLFDKMPYKQFLKKIVVFENLIKLPFFAKKKMQIVYEKFLLKHYTKYTILAFLSQVYLKGYSGCSSILQKNTPKTSSNTHKRNQFTPGKR